MSASSNITMRPRFKTFMRAADGMPVLVNLDRVVAITPFNNGARLSFGGNTPADRLDVADTMLQLRVILDP
jgi:hypothetical protein